MSCGTKKFIFGNKSTYERELELYATKSNWSAFMYMLSQSRNKQYHHQSHVVPCHFVDAIVDKLLSGFRHDNVSKRPTVAIVDAFIRSCRATCEKENGKLLIAACRLGASFHIVKRCMNINPNVTDIVDNDGWTPLSHAVAHPCPNLHTIDALLKEFPDMVRKVDCNGCLPVHQLILGPTGYNSKHMPSLEVMGSLLRAYPDAALAQDDDGDTPLNLIWEKISGRHHRYSNFFDGSFIRSNKVRMDEDVHNALSRIYMILLAATTKSLLVPHPSESVDKKWRLIDAAVSIGFKCPSEMLEYLLALHFRHPRKRDEEGMLPLHIVAAAPDREQHFQSDKSFLHHVLESFPEAAEVADNMGRLPLHINASVTCPPESFEELHDIHRLLKAFPAGARRRDKDGRLPLHHAIVGGRKWYDGVESLFKTYPRALEVRDGRTGLSAFMLAGASSKCDMDTAYELLRADPTLVKSGIGGTKREFKRKIAMLESQTETFEQQNSKFRRRCDRT